MRISFSSYHKYPGSLHGVAAHSVHDNIVKGLCELGHEVWYHLKEQPQVTLPDGAIYSKERRDNADIYHINDGSLEEESDKGIPWVRALHSDIRLNGFTLDIAHENWIYVSKTLADLYGSDRYVLNGVDPKDFVYSETKDDYLFFIVGGLQRAEMKGLEMALEVADKSGIELKIAGSSQDQSELDKFQSFCEKRNVTFLGPVFGQEKADLFAGAMALLFPSKYNEACPLVISESLMSGTPVIASTNGAIPELLNDKIGFVCNDISDYMTALDSIGTIEPNECRTYAMEHFHYLKMAKGYAAQYEYELAHRN